jgi:hypothetical protein
MRREGDAVPFHDSVQGMLVLFIGPDRARDLVAGLFQQRHAGDRLISVRNRDRPSPFDVGRSAIGSRCYEQQQVQKHSCLHASLLIMLITRLLLIAVLNPDDREHGKV